MVWNYTLDWAQIVGNDGRVTFKTRRHVRWLHVDSQYEWRITVWGEVDTEQPEIEVTLIFVGTGQQIPSDAAAHVGSALITRTTSMFHVYTQLRPEDYIIRAGSAVTG